MKRGSYVLIIFLIFFFLFLVAIASFLYFEFGKPPTVKANSYLEINLSGEIQEKAYPDPLTSLLAGRKPLSIYDIWMNLRKAKVDNRIKTLVLRLGYLQCDWAKVEEIREMILDFRTSGKKAYAYIEEALDFDKEYYLATACDKIILHPLGSLIINGIGGNTPFVKNALDKLGIKAEFEHVEEFKTAYNMFTEEGFTPAHKQMMESLYESIFSHYTRGIAEARGKSEEEIRAIIDHAYYQGEKALESGLVDELLFADQLEDLLHKDEKKIHKISYATYLKTKPSSLGLNQGKKVAIIYGIGPIHTGEGLYSTMGSTTVARWIKKIRMDSSIVAVVFRVDSPGGSAVASDIIWREVVLTKEKKPFVVSMSDVAGSGGYWVSMAAHKIVVQPQTFTGSIGVLSGKFNMEGLYEKIGITSEKLTYGKRADLFSTFRGLKPDEKELLKKEILWIYDRFVTKVAEGRNMSKEEVDRLGRGRVWTGSQAKDQGLADEIGGLSKALEIAKELAGIPPEEEVKLVVWPKKASLFDVIFGRGLVKVKSHTKTKIEKVLLALQTLGKEKIWALMPFWDLNF